MHVIENGEKCMKHQLILFTLISITTLHAANDHAKEIALTQIERGKQYLNSDNKAIAQTYFHRAVEMDPTSIDALHYLAATLYYSGQYHQACTYFKTCITKDPTHGPSQYCLAVSLSSLGRFNEAQKLLELLHTNNPENKLIDMQLLPLYIRSMDWNNALPLCTPNDLWRYTSDISDQTIVLTINSPENHLGDVLQMVRYAKHLHQAGAKVIVQTQKIFIPLLRLCPYIQTVVHQESIEPVDHRYTLDTNTFMICMRDTLAEPSKDIPYLYPDEQLRKKCKSQLWYDPLFKVGISWQAEQIADAFSGTQINDPHPLQPEMLDPLFDQNEISLYTVTNGSQRIIDQLNAQNKVIYKLNSMTDSGPFMDTAAIIHNMDLIITVDNFIAHLAGALGKPVWLLLPKSADPRWFADRDDSPWYPTMRIFRQEKQGEWQSVINNVALALQDLLAKK